MLAATGPRAGELAGEISDGLIAPPYANPDHLRNVLLPAAERGLERSGRSREDFTVSITPLLAVSEEDAEHARRMIALWCGTRSYRFVFEPYGLGGLADELAEISLSDDPDRTSRMADRIDDDLLDLFAVVCPPERLGAQLRARFGGIADRVTVPSPITPDSPYHPARLGLATADPHLETTS